MIVKNEEKYIDRCLQSVFGLVDEIVVVDTGSTDRTVNILKTIENVKLYHFQWCDDFSAARNFSIGKTTGDYVLVLDADEYMVNGSRSELESIVNKNAIGRIQIKSRFNKDNQEYYSKSYVSRFFPPDVKYTGFVHEQLDSDKPRVKININVEHDGYFEMNKSKRNIPLIQKLLGNNPTNEYYLFQLGKELRINKQYEEAFYFLQKAYELTHKKSAYYDELVLELINSGKECGKEEVLIVISENEVLLKDVSDFHFAKGLFYLNFCLYSPETSLKYIHRIESSFLTCLKLNEKKHSEYLQGTSTYLPAYNLGVFYEVTGNIKRALDYYRFSARYNYSLAENRLKILLGN